MTTITSAETPPVTILMPVRNGAKWILDSLGSLLLQTYTNFDVLLVDDSSTDESVSIARRMLGDRVNVIKSQGPGIANALATGVRRSQREFICRMDVDDLAQPTRLSRQIEFLALNPNCVLVGSNVRLINREGSPIGRSHFPLSDAAIRLRMTLSNPFAHSAVTYRRSAVLEAGNYKEPSNAPFPEDYELWTRLAHLGFFANLPDTLVDYRINPSGIMQSHAPEMRQHSAAIASKWLSGYAVKLGPSDTQVAAWQKCLGSSQRISVRQAIEVLRLMVAARFSTRQRLFDPGYRISHYLIPASRTLRASSGADGN